MNYERTMYDMHKLLSTLVEHGEPDKIEVLSEMLEDLIEESEDKEKYEDSLHILVYGPHFTEDCLHKSGIRMKYSMQEVEKLVDANGIAFPDCVTMADVTYATNLMCQMFYPLISDLSTALKFAEKYIKDDTYPVKNGKAYMEWSHREELKRKFHHSEE